MKDETRAAWDRLAGAEVQAKATNYVRELILSRGAGMGALTAVTAGAILSIPFGVGLGLVPLVGFVAAGALTTLFVPDSPVFRHWVDRRKRFEHREAVRAGLLARIGELADEKRGQLVVDRTLSAEFKRHFQTHDRMRARIDSLLAGGTSLSVADIDQLDEATVDFLRLFHARLLIRERMGEGPEVVERQLHEIDRALESSESMADTRGLKAARESLEKIARMRARLPAREVALKAQLIALGESFEDLYQRVTTDPSAGSSEFLAEAVGKLSIEEELASSVEEEVEEMMRRRSSTRTTARADREAAPAAARPADVSATDEEDAASRARRARESQAQRTKPGGPK